MLLVRVPWADRIMALPFLTLLAPSKRFYTGKTRARDSSVSPFAWERPVAVCRRDGRLTWFNARGYLTKPVPPTVEPPSTSSGGQSRITSAGRGPFQIDRIAVFTLHRWALESARGWAPGGPCESAADESGRHDCTGTDRKQTSIRHGRSPRPRTGWFRPFRPKAVRALTHNRTGP